DDLLLIFSNTILLILVRYFPFRDLSQLNIFIPTTNSRTSSTSKFRTYTSSTKPPRNVLVFIYTAALITFLPLNTQFSANTFLTPPVISVPMAIPLPLINRQFLITIFSHGTFNLLPSWSFAAFMAIQSSPVRNVQLL